MAHILNIQEMESHGLVLVMLVPAQIGMIGIMAVAINFGVYRIIQDGMLQQHLYQQVFQPFDSEL